MVSLSPRANAWLIGALFVSLAFNLFVGGVWVGHRLFHARGEYGETHKREFSMMSFAERMARRLPVHERNKYMAVIDGYRPEMASAERQMRDARAKVRDALAADPFDPQALNDALANVRESFTNVQKVFHSALAAAAAALDPDGRKQLARWDRDKWGARDKDRDRGGNGGD
jgi:uncharacterized membrane protein